MQEFLELLAKGKVVVGLAPITPSTSTPDYVSLKGYQKCTVIIVYDNGNTVTGSAITLKQATAVAATGEKALAFTKQWANADVGANDTLTETAVTSNTFTTDTTNAKNGIHVIEVDADDLDQDNNFDCLRAGTGDAANMVLAVIYILHGPRYAPTLDRSAITD
jgi:hypothetical protein